MHDSGMVIRYSKSKEYTMVCENNMHFIHKLILHD